MRNIRLRFWRGLGWYGVRVEGRSDTRERMEAPPGSKLPGLEGRWPLTDSFISFLFGI